MKKIVIQIMLIFLCLVIGFSVPISSVYAETIEDYTAKALFLIDYNTGEVLFEKNSNEKMPVASIVKLMTILLTLENIEAEKMDINEIVVVSENAAGMGGSQVFLEAGGEYKVGDLLKSVIVSSANDASVALAERISGNVSNFVELMNNRAKGLGLTNTHYSNPTGLPAPEQFSSARDVAVLLKEVAEHELYHNYSSIWIDKIIHPKNRETELVNTNKLIRYFAGCDGGKTGSTAEAGYCLGASVKRGDMRLISVVLGAKTGKLRFAESSKLLNFGFDNFYNKQVVSKNDLVENSIKIKGGKTDKIETMAKENIYLLCKKNLLDNIEIKYEIFDEIKAPVFNNDVVGRLYVVKNGEVVKECDLISKTNVEKRNYIDNINKAIDNWKIA